MECWCQYAADPCLLNNITIVEADTNPNVFLTYSTATPNDPKSHKLTFNTTLPFEATLRIEGNYTWDAGTAPNHDPTEKSTQTVTVEVCADSGLKENSSQSYWSY